MSNLYMEINRVQKVFPNSVCISLSLSLFLNYIFNVHFCCVHSLTHLSLLTQILYLQLPLIVAVCLITILCLSAVRLLDNDVKSHQPAKTVASPYEEDESFESLKELEAHAIGNLLPAEDDLFSGVTDELGYNAYGNSRDDLEDFDLFITGGGMELEGDDSVTVGQKNSDFVGGVNNGQVGPIVGEHPYGEHPSRTLFVRNINSNVEDTELKALFEVCYSMFCLSFMGASQSSLSCMLILSLHFILSAIWRYSDALYSLQASWFCYDILL